MKIDCTIESKEKVTFPDVFDNSDVIIDVNFGNLTFKEPMQHCMLQYASLQYENKVSHINY